MRLEVFQSRNLEELVDVWNRNLPVDPISPTRLESHVLLDPNFREEFCLVARKESQIIGFILGICGEGIHFPGELVGSKAWILAMAVESQYRKRGVGSTLLQELEQKFQKAGKHDIWMASYPTAYIVPGVDEDTYADGLAFFLTRGYQVAYTALAMDASLWPPNLPSGVARKEKELSAQGISFHKYSSQWLSAFRRFLRIQVPWDWQRLALRNLKNISEGIFSAEQFLLAVSGEEVVGYCQYEGEHFGPFGVAPEFQGRGIGTVLLARALCYMSQKGLHNAWVLWTGDKAAKLYARFGFKKSRKFAVLHQEI